MSDLVSVLLPYYNDEKFLSQSIESVLNQSYQNFELILINHASTDSSRSIAHRYTDTRIVHIDMHMNYGAGGGVIMQEFLNHAKGDYFKFFCADDIMYENCIQDLISYMKNHKNIDMLFGNIEYINEKGKSYNDNWFSSRENFSINHNEYDLIKLYANGASMLPYIGSFIKREAMLNVNIDMSLIMMFDMSIWLQMLLNGKKISFLNKLVCGYRIHADQVSGIAHEQLALQRSYFEASAWYEIFRKSTSIDLIKNVFADSIYIHALNSVTDIRFVVSHYFFSKYRDISNYIELHNMLQNDEYRKHLHSHFNFSIKTLRELYSESPHKKQKTSWKQKVYAKNPKSLSFIELIYLLFRNILSLKKFKKKPKKRSM